MSSIPTHRQTHLKTARSRVPALILDAALAVPLALASAPAASAAVSDCPSGATCIWRDANYQTAGVGSRRVQYYSHIGNFGFWDYGPSAVSGMIPWGNANDSASSVYNNGNYERSYLFEHANEKGRRWTLLKKTGDANLSDSSGHVVGANDILSSGYFESMVG